MPAITAYAINNYYDRYQKIEITFTKKIVDFTKIIAEDIFIKCGNNTIGCIINSCSMLGAQIILNVSVSFFELLRQNGQKVFLRFAFRRDDRGNPLTFFIQAKVEGYTPLPQKQNLYIVRLVFMQKPPDDLIFILGQLIEGASANMAKRKEERIAVTPETLKELKLVDAKCNLLMQSSKVMCLLRDISSSGAKVIVAGKGDAFLNKQVFLCLQFDGEKNTCNLPAMVRRFDEIKEREDFIALGVEFTESAQLKGFKRIIENYLKKS